MTLRNHAAFWTASFVVFALALWVLNDVLLPFVAGMAIAYLLGPIVGRMIRAGVPRSLAALLILLIFLVVVGIVLAMILPFVYREAVQLATDLPQYADQVQVHLAPYIEWLQKKLPVGDLSAFEDTLQNNIGKALRFGSSVMLGVASGGKAVAGFATFIVLTPIVAFFMMEEWVRITTWIDTMIPRHSYTTIRDLLRQIDRKVSGFIRGQLIISLLLGIVYAVALSIAGLKFGFLIGLMAGVLSIVPMVGSAVGLVAAVAVAWFQSHEWSYVGIIAAIFLVGQFLEGNVITPRIMGQSVGLHPLWILFALLAGGSLFGIVGMFLAVPVAAIIGVLLAFAISRYKASPYYGAEVPPLAQSPESAVAPTSLKKQEDV
ncbi:MAG: AI-2E family transporter [Micavibrio aeruginosavorus]|nr:AI-2E family transporter [Micavibrio aeruginosavorus]